MADVAAVLAEAELLRAEYEVRARAWEALVPDWVIAEERRRAITEFDAFVVAPRGLVTRDGSADYA